MYSDLDQIITDPKDEFEERLNLWTLSDEKRMEFICALHCKIVREFSKAVTLYEDVSILFL
jgi:hypothetical protein